MWSVGIMSHLKPFKHHSTYFGNEKFKRCQLGQYYVEKRQPVGQPNVIFHVWIRSNIFFRENAKIDNILTVKMRGLFLVNDMQTPPPSFRSSQKI